MKIEHNSRDIFYRSPFGAVIKGSKVKLKIAVSGGGIPKVMRVWYFRNNGDVESTNMHYIFDIGEYCIYQADICLCSCDIFWYYFEIDSEKGHCFYGNNELCLGGTGKVYNETPSCCYQITVYSEDYDTPQWWRETICYQIFCDRFCNGNEDGSFLGTRNDIIKRNWSDEPYYKSEQFGGEYLANDFFGGNLSGVIKKLDYLSDLGIGAIYLNPIFKAYSNHKYDTGDYMSLDEMFGGKEDFAILCQEAEKRGIRIILDGVFNHTGSDSRYFNKNGNYDSIGAYQSKESEFYNWYNFEHWNDDYECWWGIKTLPRLKMESENILNYFLTGSDSVIKHWLKDGAYGWRLDVVDELSDDFVKALRREVKKTNSEAVIIGEVWEDASNKVSYGAQKEYFLGEELDSVMNYPLRDALIEAVTERITAAEFEERIMSLKENYPRPAFYSCLNILSSHDIERVLTAAGGAPDRRNVGRDFQAHFELKGEDLATAEQKKCLLVMLQMLLPGVPCIYYGDEAGMQGYGDPFNRRTYPWGDENKECLNWYKKVISLRKNNQVYVSGEFETVYKDKNCWCFIRYLYNDKRLVAVNFGSEAVSIRIDAARFDICELLDEFNNEKYFAEDGIFFMDLDQCSVKSFSSD